MDTVVDIDPASFALTPGRAETVTLTVHNHGEDTESYHLSAAGEAADHVVIEPATLLVDPGETGTATATIDLPPDARWPVGRLVVRFDVAAAAQPDDPPSAEAIVAVRPVSELRAALTPTHVDGRRRDETMILIANSGNAHAYAHLSVDAGELAVEWERRRVTVPADSTETVELGLRARRILWRGEPVEHPFVVTVAPETAPAIQVAGTFSQQPIFSRPVFTAALAVAGAIAVLAIVGLAALIWSNAIDPGANQSATSADETSAPPVEVAVELAATDLGLAGDHAVIVVEAGLEDAPEGALAAIAVRWPAELALTDSTCEGWVGPEIDRELQGHPRSGDECLIDTSGAGGRAELTFMTPPAGFNGQVDASATRLVTVVDGEVVELETGAESEFGETDLTIDVQPYLFWLDVSVAGPDPDPDSDDGERQATIGVHRTLSGDETDESARLAFELLLPGFAELSFMEGCDAFGENDATCVLFFDSDLDFWEVTATIEIDEDARDAGPLSAQGVALSIDDEPVPPSQLGEQIRGAETLLLAADVFPVDVELDADEAEAGEAVTATVAVAHTPLPNDVEAFHGGSWVLGVELSWPESLVPSGQPEGCASFHQGVCELPGPAAGDRAVITLSFTVADDAFEGGDVAANGARLAYDPTTEADERDGREQPRVELPPDWIGSDAAEFFPF